MKTNIYKRNLIDLSIDCTLIKSINGRDVVGRNPCDRGRSGTKISMITDVRGVPVGLAVDGANVSDNKLVQRTIDNLKVRRKTTVNLHADKGYSYATTQQIVTNNKMKLKCENKKNAKVKLFDDSLKINSTRYVPIGEASFGSAVKKI